MLQRATDTAILSIVSVLYSLAVFLLRRRQVAG